MSTDSPSNRTTKLSAMKENNGWISVDERLPEVNESDSKGYVLAFRRRDRQNGWPSSKGLTKYFKVSKNKHTHWMPLTEPPTVETGYSHNEGWDLMDMQ